MAFFYRGGSSQLKAKKKKKRWGWNELREVKGAKPNSWTMHAFLQFASPLPKKEKKKKSFQTWGHLLCSGHYPNTLHAS